jgi:streptogramin lyase
MPRWLLQVVVASFLLASAIAATPASAVQITEFALPQNSKPLKITAGPGGYMWFTDVGTNAIGRIAMSGEVAEFGEGISAGAGLDGIAAGPDGNVWFTERFGHKVGRITPTGLITEFAVPSHPVINSITVGPGNKLWFTESSTNHIGAIDPGTGVVSEFAGGSPGPYGEIVAGPDGNLWYTVPGEALIDQMTPAGSVKKFGPLPPSDCASGAIAPCPNPEDIAVGSEGNLWVSEERGNWIARIAPAGSISKYSSGLAPGAHVGDLTAGPEGNMWFPEIRGDQVGRIAPSGAIAEFGNLPSAGAEPSGIATGSDGNLWVTETAAHKIARVTPEVPPIVATGAATQISSSSATVTGTVRSRGSDTHYDFEYGLTPSYGQATPAQDNGAGDNVQPVAASLPGLGAHTTYHYRVVAFNASGTAYGQDQTLLTASPPPTVTVGSFAMYFRGKSVNRRYLRLSELVVIGVHSGERVSYLCKRCHGGGRSGRLRAYAGKVAFHVHDLVVTGRSLIQVTVVDPNGSRRTRTYGFSVAAGETAFRSERCFLPGGRSPVRCPGGAIKKKHASHRRRTSRRHRSRGGRSRSLSSAWAQLPSIELKL